jgi:hypothetical protein
MTLFNFGFSVLGRGAAGGAPLRAKSFPKVFLQLAEVTIRLKSLKKANHSKGWDAKPLAYVRSAL